MNQKQEDRVIGVLNAWVDESDVAVAQYYGERSRDVDLELYNAIYDLVEAVEDKEIDAGAIPQKSVITGTFEKALNAYYRGNVHVAGKEIITFGYNIGGISDAKIESIEEVIGSEEALSQSSQWLTENLQTQIQNHGTGSRPVPSKESRSQHFCQKLRQNHRRIPRTSPQFLCEQGLQLLDC